MRTFNFKNLVTFALLCINLLFFIGCSSAADFRAQGQGAGVRLVIKRGTEEVTDKTLSVFAGEQIVLTSSVTNGSLVGAPMWDVPGGDNERIANWVPSDSKAEITPLTALDQTNVSFYLLKKGVTTVTLRATVAGNPIEGFVKLSVKKPTHQLNVETGTLWARDHEDYPDVPAGRSLSYGGDPAITPIKPGISFEASFPEGLDGGKIEWIQIVNSSSFTSEVPNGITGIQAGNYEYKQVNVPKLDLDYPYPPATPLRTNDSPGADGISRQLKGYSRAGSYTMYLMWRPAGENSIYVPLTKADWGFSGRAFAPMAGQWLLDPNSPGGSEPVKAETDDQPTWAIGSNVPRVNKVTYTP